MIFIQKIFCFLLPIAFAPLIIFLWGIVKMTSKGTGLYRSKRLECHKEFIYVWNIRTMQSLISYKFHQTIKSAIEWTKGQQIREDVRVTAVGKCLQRFSLDELPQLWNVMIGNMNFVGSRPIILEEEQKCGRYSREIHNVKTEAHSKKMCMLVNSACLRCCSVQIWHDNFICHESWSSEKQEFILRYSYCLCGRYFKWQENLVDFLQMSWIRPEYEYLHYYAPCACTMKLATRRTNHPELILNAYSNGSYDGNMLDYIGIKRQGIILDNKAFPEDLSESDIAKDCALNCTECGTCNAVLKQLLKQRESPSTTYTLNWNPLSI